MNKSSVPIILISCFLAVTGVAGYLLPSAEEANPTRVLMENTGGRVVFTHLDHSTPTGKYGDSSCATCHHELNIGASAASGAKALAAETSVPKVIPCKSCHGAVDNSDFIEAHQRLYRARSGDESCVSCHHSRIDRLADGLNHEDHKNYAEDDCESCHHPV